MLVNGMEQGSHGGGRKTRVVDVQVERLEPDMRGQAGLKRLAERLGGFRVEEWAALDIESRDAKQGKKAR